MGTSTIDPVLLTISPSWISLHSKNVPLNFGAAKREEVSNLPIVTQDDDTHVVCLQVESHTLDSRLELHHLTSLHFGETEDSSDTITDGDNGSELLEVVLRTGKTTCGLASA